MIGLRSCSEEKCQKKISEVEESESNGGKNEKLFKH